MLSDGLNHQEQKKECQQVFGLPNYHRVCIKNFSKIAAPLTRAYSEKSNFK